MSYTLLPYFFGYSLSMYWWISQHGNLIEAWIWCAIDQNLQHTDNKEDSN